MADSRIVDQSLYSILLQNDIATDELIYQQPRITIEDNDIGVVEYTHHPILNDENIGVYRPEYDYASIKLFSYKDKEEDVNKLAVTYELIIEIKNNYYVLEKLTSSNGDAVFKNLAVGQKYYIRASDIGSQYKSQMMDFTPTEKDHDMKVVLLENYNHASDLGFTYSFFLKNIIDEEPFVYVTDQPNISLYQLDKDKYALVGTPHTRNIKLHIEHEKGLDVVHDILDVNIIGDINPVEARNHIIYEAPYRILKLADPDLDNKITKNKKYSKLMIQTERIDDRNIGGILYISNGNGSYIKDISYQHTNTFKIKSVVNRTIDILLIKNLFDSLNAGDVIISNYERMLVIEYNSTTSQVRVKRGIDGTIPVVHDIDSLVYIEQINISSYDSTSDSITVNASSYTFSNETKINPDNDKIIQTIGLLSRPYPPANVKINGRYWPAYFEGDLIISWVNRNRSQQTGGEVLGWFDDSVTLEIGVTCQLILTEFDENNMELVTQNANVTAVNTFTLLASSINANTRKIQIILKTVRDVYECLSPFDHTIFISNLTAPSDVTFEVLEL